MLESARGPWFGTAALTENHNYCLCQSFPCWVPGPKHQPKKQPNHPKAQSPKHNEILKISLVLLPSLVLSGLMSLTKGPLTPLLPPPFFPFSTRLETPLPLLNLQEKRIGSLHLQFIHGPEDMQRCIKGIMSHLKPSLAKIRRGKRLIFFLLLRTPM